MGFMDLREWIALLEKEGELRRITAEVDWDREIGAIARRVLEKKGPALLFENINGYRDRALHEAFHRRAREPAAAGAGARLSHRTPPTRTCVQYVMKKNRETIAAAHRRDRAR